ncbi:MAG TPA: hypothetical protein VHP33_12625 [Polyangiaceae bacterium]|nr:hypothetical protein [Polyangiaceae bacterium]
MSGSSDDVPARSRGAVPPPPSSAPGDAPEPIDVPRMDPPPPSLEAMVTSTRPTLRKAEPATSWWVWLVVALLTAAVSAYVLR